MVLTFYQKISVAFLTMALMVSLFVVWFFIFPFIFGSFGELNIGGFVICILVSIGGILFYIDEWSK